MARIPQYRSQVDLQPAALADTRVNSAVPDAMAKLGSAGTDLAGVLLDREEKRTEFETNAQYRKVLAEQDTALFEQSQNMEAGGRGFTNQHSTQFKSATDTFLAGIEDPDRRARYEGLVAVDREQARLSAAKVERGEVVRYQTNELTDVMDAAAMNILNSPDSIDEQLESIKAAVGNSSLSPADKDNLINTMQDMAVASYLDGIEDDPIRVLRETGGSIMDLPPEQRASAITQGLVEYGAVGSTPFTNDEANPRAGAFGMRVEDLNRLLSEDGAEMSFEKDQWDIILSDPDLAGLYAQKRIEELMAGDIDNLEDAYAAFYMGEDFVKGSWAYGDVPDRARKAIRAMTGALKAPDVASSEVVFLTKEGGVLPRSAYDEINPNLTSKLRTSLARAGMSKAVIRDAERPSDASYGAKKSEHHTDAGRGGAYDIDVSRMSHKERIALIEVFSAEEIQGIGVYNNSIHVDLGGLRVWGPQLPNGKWGPPPAWAKDVLNRHITGKIDKAPQNNVSPRLRNGKVSSVVAARRRAMTDLGASSTTSTQLRENGQALLDDAIAAITAGLEPPKGDLRAALSIQTPSVRRRYNDNLFVAKTVSSVTNDIDAKSDKELAALANQVSNPKLEGVNTAVGQRVVSEVEDKIEEVRDERKSDPVGSSFLFEGIEEEWSKASVNGELQPGAVEEFIRLTTKVQREQFLLPPKDVRTLPDQYLSELASQIAVFTRNPDLDKDMARFEADKFMFAAQAMFGEYADEVVFDAIRYLQGDYEDSPEMHLNSLADGVALEQRNARKAKSEGGGDLDPDAISAPTSPAPTTNASRAMGDIRRLPTDEQRKEYFSTLAPHIQKQLIEKGYDPNG